MSHSISKGSYRLLSMYVSNKRGGPKKQGGLVEQWGRGENFLLLHEKQGEVVKISEIE